MKIAILGAAAGIGLVSVTQALEKGHQVIALSTNTDTIPNHPSLTKVNGSATSVEDLKKVITGTDAILITVGTKNKKATTLFSDIAKALITATDELHYSAPVLIITGFGSGESAGYLSFFMRTVIKLFLKEQYINKTVMEELISKSQMNWEMVRPGMLTNGQLTKKYRGISKLDKQMKVGKISRADVAHYLITEAEQPQNLKKYIALTY
jgi:putative NADH-flavin reductase